MRKIKDMLRRKKSITVNDVKVSIKYSLNNISNIKKYLASLNCPNCGEKKKLLLVNYEMGEDAWEAKVGCSKCLSKGILNSTGIHFSLNVNKVLVEES